MARTLIVGKGPRVPGGLALGSLLALAFGVALWWVLDTLFPALGRFVRGPGAPVRGGVAAPTTVTV